MITPMPKRSFAYILSRESSHSAFIRIVGHEFFLPFLVLFVTVHKKSQKEGKRMYF